MAAPHHPSGREDDWGKLASELLGINLGVDDDLDLSDLEPPPPPAPPPPPKIETPPPVAPPAPVEIDLADMDFEADEREPVRLDDFEDAPVDVRSESIEEFADDDDDDDDDDDEEEEDEDEDVTADAPAATEEAKDDFWDALESWDWETAEEPSAAAVERGDRPRHSDDRGGRDRDRSGGTGRSRSERGSREERPPRRDGERPARSDRADTDRRERRPEPRAERPARDVPQSSPRSERVVRQDAPVDEFGAGVVEESAGHELADWEESAPPPPRPPRPEPRRVEVSRHTEDDDFATDLVDDELDELPEAEAVAGESREESERPRRRRRRRRRRSSGERTTPPAVSADDEESMAVSEPDGGEEEFDDVEATPARPDTEEVAGEERREARGRRRRRRRPGDRGGRPVRENQANPAARDDVEGGEELEPEVEPVVAMTYEDVPTWEEAISYLLKPAGESRRDGGYRSGPPRRR